MIEKLPFEITQGEYEGKKFDIKSHTSPFDMQVKINELIDIINTIVVDVDGTKCVDGSKSPAENTQDKTPRCPFCGEELYYAQEIDGGFEILTCDCPHGIWLFGNDKMWYNLEKAITELERTRKALDVAVDALKNMNEIIKNYEYGNGLYYALDGHDTMLIAEYVEKALDQITAEQKDVK